MMANMKSIILMGIKHCGKTTQGKLIASKLNIPFYDTDDIVLSQTGKTPRQVYETEGEEAFIQAEQKACAYLVKTISDTRAVIATGGGICKNTQALELLHTIGTFVFLEAPESIAAERIVREAKTLSDGKLKNLPAYIAKKNPHSLAEVRTFFHSFYVDRVKQYQALADVSVPMTNAPKQVNTERILQALDS